MMLGDKKQLHCMMRSELGNKIYISMHYDLLLAGIKELEKSFGDRPYQLWIANGRREGPEGTEREKTFKV